jgi:hypothetical protein
MYEKECDVTLLNSNSFIGIRLPSQERLVCASLFQLQTRKASSSIGEGVEGDRGTFHNSSYLFSFGFPLNEWADFRLKDWRAGEPRFRGPLEKRWKAELSWAFWYLSECFKNCAALETTALSWPLALKDWRAGERPQLIRTARKALKSRAFLTSLEISQNRAALETMAPSCLKYSPISGLHLKDL